MQRSRERTEVQSTPEDLVAQCLGDPASRAGFVLRHDDVELHFHRRSPVLFVTFDNIGTLRPEGERRPWLAPQIADAGHSVLGLVATRRDWYRNQATPELIGALAAEGFFGAFERVIFIGASMGGFAAITFARLVPGAEVLAFSPQSTLAPRIVPFEGRYPEAVEKWDWSTGPFHDAAGAVDAARSITLIYDPFVAEDRAHALRLDGANVRHVKIGHLSHQVLRPLRAMGLLDPLVAEIGAGAIDLTRFRRALRARRGDRDWQRGLIADLMARGHPRLALSAIRRMEALGIEGRFLRDALAALLPGAPRPVEGPRLGEAVLSIDQALVVPWQVGDRRNASGVFDQEGRFVQESRAWIRADKVTPRPEPPKVDPGPARPGHFVFAGHMRGHFGHFLAESTARLWALDQIGEPIDGILFLPFRRAEGQAERAIRRYGALLSLLCGDLPIRVIERPQRFERISVPELGFGWADGFGGTHAYREFIRARMKGITGEGGPDLYISRSRLPPGRGGILGETYLEAIFRAAGYEIFHPEEHTPRQQLARYRAARRVVGLDGSALHLVPFVVAPEAQVAIIQRRSRANLADFIAQFQGFAGIDAEVIDAVTTDWVGEGREVSDYRSLGELDLAQVTARLVELGFLDDRAWPLPDPARIAASRHDFQRDRGMRLRAVVRR